ncbi:DUF1659 domain-containing protein [Pradoshia sp.]|uniref:DUF1659 domain-containing protein n=1 Tax=Pradoshia sp. TaxID=2651281 RepID=UPI003F0BFDF8
MNEQFLEATKLQIEFAIGTDLLGKPVTKKKLFSNMNSAASGNALKRCADAIVSLQKHTAIGVKRLDTWGLES